MNRQQVLWSYFFCEIAFQNRSYLKAAQDNYFSPLVVKHYFLLKPVQRGLKNKDILLTKRNMFTAIFVTNFLKRTTRLTDVQEIICYDFQKKQAHNKTVGNKNDFKK